MTAYELINQLSKYPPEYDVYVRDTLGEFTNIDRVDLSKRYDLLIMAQSRERD